MPENENAPDSGRRQLKRERGGGEMKRNPGVMSAVALILLCLGVLLSCEHCFLFPPAHDPPEVTITADTTSVHAGESVTIQVNGQAKGSKGSSAGEQAKSATFIVEYYLGVDYNGDGNIDKEIRQGSPIETNETLNYVGTAKFHATCTDNLGLTSNPKSLEVIVNEAIPGNHKPVAVLNSDKTSLIKGESANINLSGTDDEGVGDIQKYELNLDYDGNGTIDETISQNSPINTSKRFDIVGTAKVYGKVTDSKNESDEKTLEIRVSQIPINQPPVVNLAGVNSNALDGKQVEISLPEPTDVDTPGKIPYTNAEVIEGNDYISSISLDNVNNKLIINAKPVSQNKSYKIRLSFGTDNENKNTADLEGIIYNLCNIKGQIESNNEDKGITKSGDVVGYTPLYDQGGNFMGKDRKILDEIHTNDGKFDVQAKEVVDKILFRARFDETNYEGDNKSFTRSVILDASKDYDNVIMVCEESPKFPVTKEQFRNWILDTDNPPSYYSTPLLSWDLSTIEGIEVYYKNPTGIEGEFSQLRREALRERILAYDGVKALFNHRIDNKLDSGEIKVKINDETTIPEPNYYKKNWIFILPVYDLRDVNGTPCKGLTRCGYLNNNPNLGIINYGNIRLDTMYMTDLDIPLFKRVAMHELNHAILTPYGEGTKTVNPYSVQGNRLTAGEADIKKAGIFYSKREGEGEYKKGELLRLILGLDF